MLKCVVFDMDGTLLDTERLAIRFWIDKGEEYGVDLPLEFIMGGCGCRKEDVIKRFREHYPDFPVKEAMVGREDWWAEQEAKGLVQTKPGAVETLTRLRALGLKLVVATSNLYEKAVRELKETGLYPLLDDVVSGDELPLGRGKPAPDIFLLAMKKMGCAPDECIVVEDSVSGAAGGVASGARTVMIPDLLPPSEELEGKLYRCLGSLVDLIPEVEALM